MENEVKNSEECIQTNIFETSCINLGYYQIKASNNIVFKSKAKLTTDNNNLALGDILELDDKKYIMEIGQPMLKSDKTTSELTKVFVLNVLAKQINETNKGNFNVLMTSPPISFAKQSKDLPEFLQGIYNIKYNGKPYTININKVVVLPETFLVYTVNNPAKLEGKKTLIIDIGGRTTNICLLTDCKFSLEDYITISKGMYYLDNKIAKEINNNYTTYSGSDIDLLRKQNAKVLEDNSEIINSVYKQYIEEAALEIQKNSWQIDDNTIVLICGGGGIILEQQIKQVFSNAQLSNDPLFDNLKALELLSKEVFC